MGELSKLIGYGITMCLVYTVMNYLHNRDNGIDKMGNPACYVIKTPAALAAVYGAIFVTGILLFGLFTFVKLKKNPNLDKGNFIFALVFAAIGLFVMILASKWRVVVNNNQVTVHRLFRSQIQIQMDDITGELGSKDQLMVYVDGKKMVTIDSMCDNYYPFRMKLEEKGQIKARK